MSEIHRRGIDVRELDTVLAEDFEFEGEMEFSKPLMLKGKFKGEVKATSDFIVAEGAEVEARIEGRFVDVRGKVTGNIEASERIDLGPTARVRGDLTAPEVVVEAGARFNGLCTMFDTKGENP
jgi:cytoskeletal protein CcmA (bactofilin family)